MLKEPEYKKFPYYVGANEASDIYARLERGEDV